MPSERHAMRLQTYEELRVGGMSFSSLLEASQTVIGDDGRTGHMQVKPYFSPGEPTILSLEAGLLRYHASWQSDPVIRLG